VLATILLCAVVGAADNELLEALLSPQQSTRVSAAARVRELPEAERVALAKHLAALLKGTNTLSRRAAAKGIAAMGPEARVAAPALVAATDDRDLNLRIVAIRALAAVDDRSPATVAALVAATADKHSRVRGDAIFALWNIGGAEERVLDVLIDALHDIDKSNRWRAAIALGRRGQQGGRAAHALGAALSDEDAKVRNAAVEALQAMGESGRPAAQALIAQLDSTDTEFALDVAGALGGMNAPAELVVPRLKSHLTNESWKTRSEACWAISKFKGGARLAMTELEKAALDPHPAVRRTALQAIYAADPKRPGAYAAYQKAYDEEQKWRVLDHYDHDVEAALASLSKGLREGNENSRAVAANSLANLGADARPAVPALIAALKDPSIDVRSSVLGALAEIRVPDPTPLIPSLQDKEAEIREAAVSAIGRALTLDGKALIAIAQRLADEAEDVKVQARWTLEGLGASAEPAIATLRKLLRDPDESVRDAARMALSILEADAD